eukprot:COSAG01_NODE_228_length_21104_cov_210.303832_11_plen_75_part_00
MGFPTWPDRGPPTVDAARHPLRLMRRCGGAAELRSSLVNMFNFTEGRTETQFTGQNWDPTASRGCPILAIFYTI